MSFYRNGNVGRLGLKAVNCVERNVYWYKVMREEVKRCEGVYRNAPRSCPCQRTTK